MLFITEIFFSNYKNILHPIYEKFHKHVFRLQNSRVLQTSI